MRKVGYLRMNRSEINEAIRNAIELLDANNIKLPVFAYWNIEQWRDNKCKIENIKEVMLGWDVTDFGYGAFEKRGSVLFTVRNGSLKNSKVGTPYAEKIIIQRHEQEQEIPFHYHNTKMEDIINRGGGILALELYNSTPEDMLDKKTPVKVKMDGIWHTFEPGEIVEVEQGNSITLSPGLFHRFWAKKGNGDLVVGEVSSVNDDVDDNVFLDKTMRFTTIEEDEKARYPLCNEYENL